MKYKAIFITVITGVFLLSTPLSLESHDNKGVHPFSLTAESAGLVTKLPQGNYNNLLLFFNEDLDSTNGYDPKENPDPSLCRPGTRGTIVEDYIFLDDNFISVMNHYYAPYRANGNPGWWWWGPRKNTVEYARELFNKALDNLRRDGLGLVPGQRKVPR